VIGLGTLLDTLRFRSLLAMALSAPATQLQAMILGEHGDSMVPVWSSASLAGLPLEKLPGFTPKLGEEVFQRARTSGAEMIKKKTGAGFAVGVSIAEVVHAVALDSKRVLPWPSPCRQSWAAAARKRRSRSICGPRRSRASSGAPPRSATRSTRSSPKRRDSRV
jgi:malate/lactate dehydrogenase